MNERRDFSFGCRVLCIISALHIAAAGQAWAWEDDTRFRGGLTIPPLLRASSEASQSKIENRKSEIDFFDLNTQNVRRVFGLEKSPPTEWMGGLPVSSDGKWMLFSQLDEQSSDLMMIENWR